MKQECLYTALRMIRAEEPWQAVILPVAKFPVPPEDVFAVRRVWNSCRRALIDRGGYSSEVFLEFNSLRQAGSRSFVDHGREWMPQMGLGVWPDREPPALRTKRDFADLEPDQKLPPCSDQVLRIAGLQETKEKALSIMFGFGTSIEILTSGGEVFLKAARARLLPPIKERMFQAFPFYIPLLEAKTICHATASQLEEWFCGAAVYIRESREDQGILIASCGTLRLILEELGGRFDRAPDPVWRIPV